ncbi:MAG: SCO family protein [Methylococcales bacterium]|nr:SCO family protein [Methylococcales bacterium]
MKLCTLQRISRKKSMTNPELPITDSPINNNRFARLIGVVLFLTAIAVLGIIAKELWFSPHKQSLLNGSFLPEPRKIDAFNLVSAAGTPFTLADFRGHWTIVFAGYSYCSEVCPTTLALLQAAKAKLGDDAKQLKVLFLSIDSEHDTPERLAEYIHHFDPEFQAATGSAQQIEALASNLELVAFKEENKATGQYEFQHSAQLILVNPKGQMAGHLSPPFTVETLVVDIKTTLSSE